MATQRVWFYKNLPGLQSSGEGARQNLLQEPFISTETVDTTSGAAASGAAPGGTDCVVVSTGAAVYYYVNEPGGSTDADNTCRELANGSETAIHIKPGGNISMLEV